MSGEGGWARLQIFKVVFHHLIRVKKNLFLSDCMHKVSKALRVQMKVPGFLEGSVLDKVEKLLIHTITSFINYPSPHTPTPHPQKIKNKNKTAQNLTNLLHLLEMLKLAMKLLLAVTFCSGVS